MLLLRSRRHAEAALHIREVALIKRPAELRSRLFYLLGLFSHEFHRIIEVIRDRLHLRFPVREYRLFFRIVGHLGVKVGRDRSNICVDVRLYHGPDFGKRFFGHIRCGEQREHALLSCWCELARVYLVRKVCALLFRDSHTIRLGSCASEIKFELSLEVELL